MSFNRVIVKGFVGNAPEVVKTRNDKTLVKFSVACRGWDGEKETTEWVPVTMVGKRAQAAADWIEKGMEVLVEGKFSTDSWTTESGERRSKSYVTGFEWDFCGKAAERRADPVTRYAEHPNDPGRPNADPDDYPPPARPAKRPAQPPIDFDDEIPF